MLARDRRSMGVGPAARISLTALLLLAALVAGFVALPSRALAVGETLLAVSQSFSTSGSVPEGVDGSFAYELVRTDATAPLPSGSTGDTYSFSMKGDATTTFDLLIGSDPSAGALAFSRKGVYSYELRCVSDPSSASGLAVDASVYTVRVSVEDGGGSALRIGWVEIRDAAGKKPNEVSFAHTFTGDEATPEPGPTPTPTPDKGNGILPAAGDTLWGLIQLSLVVCVVGVVLVVMGVRRRIRHRQGR